MKNFDFDLKELKKKNLLNKFFLCFKKQKKKLKNEFILLFSDSIIFPLKIYELFKK